MDRKQFEARYASYRQLVEQSLQAVFPAASNTVEEAANYSLLAGGKRIRPVLLLAVGDMLGVEQDQLVPLAVSLEMIHCYSLVHDDLPAMDNDDLRRGKPSNHKVYGEAMAILAGDLLLTKALTVLMEDHSQTLRPGLGDRILQAGLVIARAAGSPGMIAGQCLDIEATGQENLTYQYLVDLQRQKTGALIRAGILPALYLSDLFAGERGKDYEALLLEYADTLGLVFQVRDDLLDVTASAAELGKNPGKDSRDDKLTFVSLLGFEASKLEYQKLAEHLQDLLQSPLLAGLNLEFIQAFTDFLIDRQH